jgi:hypothetical protein
MNKKFELLREAVKTYKVNHCDGDKNEKELLEFIDELEQLTTPVVVGQSEQLIALKECRRWMINKGVNVESDFFKNIDKAINCA